MASKITGLNGVLRALDQLPKEVGEKVVVGALRSGAGVMRNEIKARAPSHDVEQIYNRKWHAERIAKYGTLKQNIRAVRSRRKKFEFKIGIGRAFWGLFVEFGTKSFRHRTRPRPFMRPAFDAAKERVVQKVAQALGTGINTAARRLAGLSRQR